MNVTHVAAFLRGEMSGRELQEHIANETEAWSRKLLERGRSAPITLLTSPETIEITPVGAGRLLDAFLSRELTSIAFTYILDAMLMSDNFHWRNDALRESMEAVLSLEGGQDVDRQQAWRAREELLSMRVK